MILIRMIQPNSMALHATKEAEHFIVDEAQGKEF